MADAKITDLTELTIGNVEPDDLVEAVDASTGTNKKVKALSLISTGSSGEMPFRPPTTSVFTLNRPATGSIVDMSNGRGVRIKAPVLTTDSRNLHYAKQAVSVGAGGWNAIARLRLHAPLFSLASCGIIVRNSGNDYSRSFSFGGGGVLGFNSWQWVGDTSYANGSQVGQWYGNECWMKVEENAALTTRKWYMSMDGDHWFLLATDTISGTAVTTTTHVGFYILPILVPSWDLSGAEVAGDCLSWQQNALS